MNYSKHLGILFILTFFSIFWCLYNALIRPHDPKKKHFMGNCLIPFPEEIQKFLPIMAKRFKNKIQFDKCFDMWSLSHFSIYFVCHR